MLAFSCRKSRVVSVDEVHTSRQTHPSPEQHRLAHLVRKFQVLRGTDQGRKFLPGKWYMLHQPAGSVRVFGVAVGAQMMKYLQVPRLGQPHTGFWPVSFGENLRFQEGLGFTEEK